MSPEPEPILLRIPEAAERLRLGRSTLYELIRAGEIPTVRIGAAVRLRPSDLAAWVAKQVDPAEPPRAGPL